MRRVKTKKKAIGLQILITKLSLQDACWRFNLQLLELLKHPPGTQSW